MVKWHARNVLIGVSNVRKPHARNVSGCAIAVKYQYAKVADFKVIVLDLSNAKEDAFDKL